MRLKSTALACATLLSLTGCNVAIPSNLLNAINAAQTGGVTTGGQDAKDDKGGQKPGQDKPMVAPQPGQPQPGQPMPAQPMMPLDPKVVFPQFDKDRSQTWSLDEYCAFMMCGGPMMPPPGMQPPVMQPPVGGNPPPLPPSPTPATRTALQVGATTTSNTTTTTTTAPMPTGGLQPPPPPQPGASAMPMPPMCDPAQLEPMFKQFDRNADGQLQVEEAAEAIVKRGPGGNPPPPPPQPNGMQPPPPPSPQTGTATGTATPAPLSCDENFARHDLDGDKAVTWEEFYRPDPNLPADQQSADKDRRSAEFKAKDANADGHLDLAELCGAANQ